MIEVVRADITTLAVDAIVNAANAMLRGGGGVDGAIHRAAGPGLMDELRRRYAGCDTGDAVITGGHELPARFVIHAVGPVWTGSDPDGLLRRTYERAIEVALINQNDGPFSGGRQERRKRVGASGFNH